MPNATTTRGRLFTIGVIVLVLACLWLYVLLLRDRVAVLEERAAMLEEKRMELLRRHDVLVEEHEAMRHRLADREKRLEELEADVAAYAIRTKAWESLGNECLDQLSHCIDAYENVSRGRLDWYNPQA